MESDDSHLQALELNAVVLACLSGLFGVYIILFILALWSIFGRKGTAHRRLRVITVAMFLVLLCHFISKALQFYRAGQRNPPEDERHRWTTPLSLVSNMTTTFSGLISDGLLAWRFYIIYERKKWALYVPLIIVTLNTLMCGSADAFHLAIYFRTTEYFETALLPAVILAGVVWGWIMFALNTVLTSMILLRIVYMYKETGSELYASIVHAVVESAMVTWFGLLMYEVLSLLSLRSRGNDEVDLGYIGISLLPVFFGISQAMITVRLGFRLEPTSSSPFPTSALHSHSLRFRPQTTVTTSAEGSTSGVDRRSRSSGKRSADEQGESVVRFSRTSKSHELPSSIL
ncbi:hypothetical protein BDV98DRAFT_507867 [Pterulicium gracile]|uniref:Uncharacterized protein n=1 Tax=Pterulicium gracile TaxID=1884261 RepID=A0A5C3QHA1_9AGAR|nr:hypothetical protein BDV98DRAFT_507867 [Pterula gracilis]